MEVGHRPPDTQPVRPCEIDLRKGGMSKELIGNPVFIRTVTHYYTGLFTKATEDGYYVLNDATWIAATGQFSVMLAGGITPDLKGAEVEPYPENQLVYVASGSIVDIIEWKHPLPRKQQQ